MMSPRLAAAARLFMLFVFPLALYVPVWLVLNPSLAVQQLLVFLALAPHVAYPLVWIVGVLREWFEAQEHIFEFMFLGLISGFVIPVLVLTPVMVSVDMEPEVSTMMLAMTIALLSTWIPLVVSSLVSRTIVDDYETAEGKDYPSLYPGKRELVMVMVGLIMFLSAPLGLFLTLLVDRDHSIKGEATLIVFAIVTSTLSFLYILAPRLGYRLAVWKKLGSTPDTSKSMAQLVWGCSVLPMILLLPIYLEVDFGKIQRNAFLTCLLGIPPFTVCEALRTYHQRKMSGFPMRLAVLFLVLVLPLGILLPTFLALANTFTATDQPIIVAFLFGSPGLFLLGVTVKTFSDDAQIPFIPLDYLMDTNEGGSTSALFDWVFAATCLLLPTIVILPWWATGDLYDDTNLVLVSYIGIFTLFIAITFAKALRTRAILRDDDKYYNKGDGTSHSTVKDNGANFHGTGPTAASLNAVANMQRN